MLPAANRGAGQNLGFPDVCNTPVGTATVPIPYPNIAMNAQATGYSQTVKVSMVNALHLGSSISMTSGDEAGTAHSTTKGKGAYTMGCPLVFIDKQPAITLTMPTTGNSMNNSLGCVSVPSSTTVLMCFDSDASEHEALADEMLGRSIAESRLLPGDVAHVRFDVIALGAATALRAEMRKLGNVRALLLDLRGCPGGSLFDAVRLADELLPKGALISELEEPDGELTPVHARRDETLSLPLVVLIDGASASSAELLAAALQDNRRALVVGGCSYGKPDAYRIVDVDGRPQRIGALRWHRPDASRRRARKLTPDVPTRDALKQAWMLALELRGGVHPVAAANRSMH